jgi:imidazolonepropionase-like amidohydrolase
MFRIRLVFLVAALLFVSVLAAAQGSAADLAFQHVTVIDTHDGSLHPDMTVVVAHGHIAAIAKASSAKLPKAAREIDATGKFLIPGLWDMHVHLAQEDKSKWTRPILLPLLVANGVTGVRDMGGNFDLIQQLRAEIEQQKLLGPRIVAGGPQHIGSGSEKIWPLSDWPAAEFARVGTAADGEQTVRTLKDRGVDFIKVQSQGPPIPREAYFAIADASRKLGIPFVGHVPDTITAEEASNAGQKSIEHLSGVFLACSANEAALRKSQLEADNDPQAFPIFATRGGFDLPPPGTFDSYSREKAGTLFALLAKNHTWQVPTLSIKQAFMLSAQGKFLQDERLAYVPPSFRQELGSPEYYKRKRPEEIQDLSRAVELSLSVVRDMHGAGVEFMAGTDLPYPPLPGWSLHDEMELLVRGGLSPLEALQAATLNPARFLGKIQQFGTVEQGKVADLVLLDSNPLADIENVRKIRAVVVNGKYLGREELDRILAETKAAATAPEAK